jgi:SAM-dependent methyltransferase
VHGHKHAAHKFHPAHVERLRDPERRQFNDPEAVWAVIAAAPTGVLVDIGAGVGWFAIPFARKMPGGTVYACDLSAEMMAHLAAAIAAEGVPNVKPVRVAEVAVPLAAGVADVVFMANLHHELEHPAQSLAEARRLLKPGGRIAIIDWKPEPTPMGPPVAARVAPAAVKAQLEAAGFRGVTAHPLLPYHYFFTGLAP